MQSFEVCMQVGHRQRWGSHQHGMMVMVMACVTGVRPTAVCDNSASHRASIGIMVRVRVRVRVRVIIAYLGEVRQHGSVCWPIRANDGVARLLLCPRCRCSAWTCCVHGWWLCRLFKCWWQGRRSMSGFGCDFRERWGEPLLLEARCR